MNLSRRSFLMAGFGLVLAGCSSVPDADDSPAKPREVILDVPSMH